MLRAEQLALIQEVIIIELYLSRTVSVCPSQPHINEYHYWSFEYGSDLLFQANQQLLNIRELELDYFTDVFSGYA
jgi:hypothetical protein